MWGFSLTVSNGTPCSAQHCWPLHVNTPGSYIFSLLLHWQLCRFGVSSFSEPKWQRWISRKRLRRHRCSIRLRKSNLCPLGTCFRQTEATLWTDTQITKWTHPTGTYRWPQPSRHLTISDLRKQIELLQTDHHALPMLNQLLSNLTTADVVYMDNVTHNNFMYKVLAPEQSITGPDIQKNYRKLLRFCHLDRQPVVDRHISQQLVAIGKNLVGPATRRIYDYCGVPAGMCKHSSHFCRLCNPRLFDKPLDDLWNWRFSLDGCILTITTKTLQFNNLFFLGYETSF